MELRAIVGRDSELRRIADFLAADHDRAPALLLEGDPGVGKTTLWEAGARLAEGRGMRVLRCAPSAAEASLSFAALTDLLDPVFDEALLGLAPARARALEAALLRTSTARTDPHGVGLGVLDALRSLAEAQPLVLAVDDWQWLDAPSEAALTFAVRRLASEPVRLLCSTRAANGRPGARPDLTAAALDRVEVRPLDQRALHVFLRDRLGVNLSRPALEAVHEATGGNPFYALQIGEVLKEGGAHVVPGRPLPVPGDLQLLLRDRLRGLDDEVKALLRLAAVLTAPTLEVLERSVASGSVAPVLDRAVDSGVVHVDRGELRFSHPLFASAVVASTTPGELREMHRRAARLAQSAEERARHLALASTRPDEAVATELDAAAEQAASRGAYGPAARLSELALEVTPPADRAARIRRTLAAADRVQRAGDGAHAQAILEELVGELPAGPQRAAVLNELAGVSTTDASWHARVCEQALTEAGEDDRLRAWIHYNLSGIYGTRGEPKLSLAHAERGVELAERCGDKGLLADTLSVLGLIRAESGYGPQLDLMRRALEAAAEGTPRFADDPEWSFGLSLYHAGQIVEAEPLLHTALEKAVESGDMESYCRAESLLAEFEVRRGTWESADRHSAEAVELAEQIEISNLVPMTLFHRSFLEAHMGTLDVARDHALRGVAASEAMGDIYFAVLCDSVLGLIALSAGDAEAAADGLRELPERIHSIGPLDPNLFHVRALAAEALIGSGEHAEAADVLSELERDASHSGHTWALGSASRCRALLANAAGDTERALEASERALSAHEELAIPFELARTLLVHGALQRRAKLKRPARETLERSREIFEQLGARIWTERCTAELARIGGRRPASDSELTATQQRVATLAAAGRSNKQIAAELYLSERTVEANLTKVYRKLGVHSRTQLPRQVEVSEPD